MSFAKLVEKPEQPIDKQLQRILDRVPVIHITAYLVERKERELLSHITIPHEDFARFDAINKTISMKLLIDEKYIQKIAAAAYEKALHGKYAGNDGYSSSAMNYAREDVFTQAVTILRHVLNGIGVTDYAQQEGGQQIRNQWFDAKQPENETPSFIIMKINGLGSLPDDKCIKVAESMKSITQAWASLAGDELEAALRKALCVINDSDYTAYIEKKGVIASRADIEKTLEAKMIADAFGEKIAECKEYFKIRSARAKESALSII